MRVPLALLTLAAAAAAQTTGPWRGVLLGPGGELPFELLTIETTPLELRNGPERIRVTPRHDGARVTLPLPPYDAALEYEVVPVGEREHGLRGRWRKTGPAGEVTMPFAARAWRWQPHPRDAQRMQRAPLFLLPGDPTDVAGRWRVQFAKDPHPAVALFAPRADEHDQTIPDGEVTGTFLTTTGDYRFLAGTARGGELRLACFDGAHAFLFAARLQPDGTLTGEFWSGTTWHEAWTARRDDKAALPDAFTLCRADPAVKLADLRYPDLFGREQRLGDHLGRVTLVYLFGSWGPNCGDAGAFLAGLQARYQDRGLRVVGLCFEHGEDRERIGGALRTYRERHSADWPILLAGPSDKAGAQKAFPVLDRVVAYPTTLFVDAEGTVRAVHTGFTGPAAPAEHEAQTRSFEALVERLLDEAGKGR